MDDHPFYILLLSLFYPFLILLLSFFLSVSYPFAILFLSVSYPFAILFISVSYPFAILFLSVSYHFAIPFFFYPFAILSRFSALDLIHIISSFKDLGYLEVGTRRPIKKVKKVLQLEGARLRL